MRMTLPIGTAARRATIGALALLLAACSPYGPVQTITWGEMLGAMAAFFVMAAAFTIFIALFVDIFRRHDLSGGAKALWVLALVILPLIGSLIYIAMRPRQPIGVLPSQKTEMSADEQFAELDRLKATGKITDAEYEEYRRMAGR
jgi:phospholipase D-like protein